MSRNITGGAIAIGILAVSGLLVFMHGRQDALKPVHLGTRLHVPAPVPRNAVESPPHWVSDDPAGSLVLEGQVLGPDGEGVGGADVWLRSVPPRTVKTGANGTFSFAHLVSREYSLTASKGELIGGPAHHKLTSTSDPVLIRLTNAAAVVVTVIDESKRLVPRAQVRVKVREGPEINAPIADNGTVRLSPIQAGMVIVEASAAGYGPSTEAVAVGAPGTTTEVTLNLRAGYAVAGRVVDETGKAIPRARVSASRGERVIDAAQALSDETGRFTIPALSNGGYMLFVIDSEHAPASPLPVKVAGAPVTDLEIVMRAGGFISGVVLDIAHRPAPFAAVQAIGFGAGGRPVPRDVTCDRNGRFEMGGLVRGKLQVHAESEAATSNAVEADLVNSPELRNLTLLLDADGVITGSVVNERGAPVPDVEVTALPAFHTGPGPVRVTLATTMQDGTFSFSGLPDGESRLGAVAHFDISGDLGQQRLTARTGDKAVRIVFATPGMLTGRVTLSGTNAAPRMFTVQLSPGSGAPFGANDGVFEYPGIAPGAYLVVFHSTEFADLVLRDIKIESGKITNLGTVTVNRGRQLVGQVVNESGAPTPGAQIKIVIQPASPVGDFESLFGVRSAVADQLGMFIISGVPEVVGAPVNSMAVVAYDPDHGSSKPLAVPEGREDPPQVTLMLSGVR